MGRICAFEHCGNSTYQLERWQKSPCDLHGCLHMHQQCICPPPFVLFTFPSVKKSPHERNMWTKAVWRRDKVTGKNWVPDKNARVCSLHFVDGKATPEHPYPTLNLGPRPSYASTPKPRKQPLERIISPPLKKKPTPQITDGCSDGTTCKSCKSCTTVSRFHTYAETDETCKECVMNQHLTLQELIEKYSELHGLTETPLPAVTKKRIDKTLHYLKTDKKVNTFTGVRSRQAFEDLLNHVQKRASTMRYWTGSKKLRPAKRVFSTTPKKSGPQRKLLMREELLMVLMKLKQNVSHDMLSITFGVSKSVVSSVFNTWIKMLAHELRPLIYWPSKDAIYRDFPRSLAKKKEYRHLRCTVDCTEIFIEKPRNLELQAQTYSDYKHHNTVKLFVAIAPNGMVSFLPPAWGGRTSDQYITRHCGFLDLLEPQDVVLADRGFPIQEDLLLRNAMLIIPPPASGLDQMSRENVKKTSEIANARIHVERAIGRMKRYEILTGTLPITLVPLIDDIATVCAALSNLWPSLVS